MSQPPHIVLSTTPAWGHLRGLCVFAAKLVAERNVVVTLVLGNWMNLLQKAEAEFQRALSDVPSPKGTFRAVTIGQHSTTKNLEELLQLGFSDVPALWDALDKQSPLTCGTGKTYPSAAKPSVAVLDGYISNWYPVARAAIPSMPILMWSSSTALGYSAVCLPTPEGVSSDGVKAEPTGRLVSLAGLPEMYDWEMFPQALPMEKIVAEIHARVIRAARESDGLLTPHMTNLDDAELLATIDRWLSKDKRPAAFNIGPLLPFQDGTTNFSASTLEAEMRSAPPGVGDAVMSFLDKVLVSRGEESAVYICLGSTFWPSTNVEHLWALLHALAQRDIPFVFSHSSPRAQIPDHIRELYKDTSKALLVPWSPQQSILAHKAIGWFVTHGGAGGIVDAVSQGVPMIGWPFGGDQAPNMAYLTHTLDVAFTLYETRTGELGLKPIKATGHMPTGTLEAFKTEFEQILDNMRGEAGSRKRRNVKGWQAKLATSWSGEGASRQALERFCSTYGL